MFAIEGGMLYGMYYLITQTESEKLKNIGWGLIAGMLYALIHEN
jgi:hypothetical protein